MVALLAEGVDRNQQSPDTRRMVRTVALLAEGVDRNQLVHAVGDAVQPSPSSRRAWIEISQAIEDFEEVLLVALLAEGVDRNTDTLPIPTSELGRPPRGGRG